ncbi:DUF4783 domain-containing protein [Mucilaginibacter litoreus]|uniref:DUF4783 domain-containing protein n=1 Tax=Mucilaginibacter litoreus TaxID=1048221 RepID=A0ABW3APR1_9SPHI
MKLKRLPLLALLLILPAVLKADAIEKIAELFKQGNAQEIARFFAPSVDVSLMDNAAIYSKAQAAIILDKFFKENKPHAVKMLHRISSNPNYNFGVLVLSTDKGKFRVAYTLKEVGKNMELIELRIESEKT